MKPNFAFDAGDARCNLTFSGGLAQDSKVDQQKAIIGNGNVHHTGYSDPMHSPGRLAGPCGPGRLRPLWATAAEFQDSIRVALTGEFDLSNQ